MASKVIQRRNAVKGINAKVEDAKDIFNQKFKKCSANEAVDLVMEVLPDIVEMSEAKDFLKIPQIDNIPRSFITEVCVIA
jgi:hypothetical protein